MPRSPARGQGGKLLQDTYAQADPVAEGAGRAPPRPAAFQGLSSPAWPTISCRSPATARSATIRRSSAALRASTARKVMLIGHEKGDDTASRLKPQFRHGQARGLSQGDPPDAAGRPLRPAGRDPGRYAGRLSRGAGGRARPGRGDRPLDRAMPGARSAADRGDRRRRRIGRRGGASPRPTAC